MQYVSKVMRENVSSSVHHFFSAGFCTTLLVFTGMVISEDWMAGLGSGASTVRTPSGEREEVIFSESAPGGSLMKAKDKQPTFISGTVFKLRFCWSRIKRKGMMLLCLLC